MNPHFSALRSAYEELADLVGILNLLWWDQQTYMPPRGAEARGRQIAALSTLIHEKILAPQFDEWLAQLKDGAAGLDEDARAYLREFTFQRDRRAKLPSALVREIAEAESKGFEAWQQARRKRDFSIFAPELKKLLALARQKADCYGWKESPWDALVQDYERGMTASKLREIFKPLREAIVSLLDRIRLAPQIDRRFLDQKWEAGAQREFCMRVARDLGYDLEAGRLDVSAHPFTTGLSLRDVRITTRYRENDFLDAFGSVVHETGHALYDQGFRSADDHTPLANAPSYGVHESQSRFWEILIGQSREFWKHYLPIAKQYFPGQLSEVDLDTFYRAVNRVQPGLIRVDADDVTYNLHVLVRFELEVLLLEGKLDVEDLPREWNKRYREYLGLDVPGDDQGCLQDVHWSQGSFGYFPSYSMGNIYSAMLLEKMEEDTPSLWDDVAHGRFEVPLGWLRKRIHREGCRLAPAALIEKAAGKPVSSQALLKRLTAKYTEIYKLS